jgi:hypothetical protein
MRAVRLVELISGVTAGILGLAGLAYAAFGLIGMFASSKTSGESSTGSSGLAQTGISPTTMLFFVVVAALAIGVALSAFEHTRSRERVWRVMLWVITGLLTLGVGIAILSIGPFLLPSVLLAIVTCVLAGFVRPARA